jgi:hypothetical protein
MRLPEVNESAPSTQLDCGAEMVTSVPQAAGNDAGGITATAYPVPCPPMARSPHGALAGLIVVNATFAISDAVLALSARSGAKRSGQPGSVDPQRDDGRFKERSAHVCLASVGDQVTEYGP